MAIGRATKGEEEIGFVDGEWCGKVGIEFYMCLCDCWCRVVVLSRAGVNSMLMADWELLSIRYWGWLPLRSEEVVVV